MNKLHTFAASIALGAASVTGLLALTPAHASAASVCDVTVVGSGKPVAARTSDNGYFTYNANKTVASVTLKATGPAGCAAPVTFTSWTAPNGTFDTANLKAQKVYAHSTQTLYNGTYTMNVNMKDCYYQLDLVKGTSPTAPDGSAFYTVGSLIAWNQGGDQSCDAPAKTPTPTPTTTTPTPKPTTPAPTTPAPTTTPEPTGKGNIDTTPTAAPVVQTATAQLPNTGPGAVIAGAVVFSLLAGVAYRYYLQRRLA